MAGGKMPAEVSPFMCGARLHAGKKKSGGLRPIAVGNMTRRLTSKCFVGALSDRIVPLLAPHQVGVSIKGGCEAASHFKELQTSVYFVSTLPTLSTQWTEVHF